MVQALRVEGTEGNMTTQDPISSEPGNARRSRAASPAPGCAGANIDFQPIAALRDHDVAPAGTVLAGRYRVEKVLGTGGMGIVVTPQDLRSGERVAIKYLQADATDDAEAMARFAREARATAGAASDHVPRTLGTGRLEDGAPYLAMECLEGTDLRTYLMFVGPLAPEPACALALQICEALAAAHAAGIIHRDIKPKNLFVTRAPDGTTHVMLLDFGISKVMTDPDGIPLTQPRMILGSPLYMSPEQMLSTRDVDCRADIWSVGVVLYEMLTGRVPFLAGSVKELCGAVIGGKVPPAPFLPGEAPEALQGAVFRCLSHRPTDRFATVGDLARALAPFAGSEGRASAERISRIADRAALESTIKGGRTH